MPDIIKIVIKGASGYCCSDEAYNDKVTITSDSIAYEYIPCLESELNPKRKWSYKTDSPLFKVLYSRVVEILPRYLEEDIERFCTDIGGIEFIVTYSDKSKYKNIFWVPSDDFKDLFRIIKQMIPSTEYTPAVLLTSDDFEDEEDV